MCTVTLFWKGSVDEVDVLEYVDGAIPQQSLAFKAILRKFETKAGTLQRQFFFPAWLADFVSTGIGVIHPFVALILHRSKRKFTRSSETPPSPSSNSR